jgi:hypothetical protein
MNVSVSSKWWFKLMSVAVVIIGERIFAPIIRANGLAACEGRLTIA